MATIESVPSEIIPGLYLGSVGCACNKHALQSLGIKHILVAAKELECYFPYVSNNISQTKELQV